MCGVAGIFGGSAAWAATGYIVLSTENFDEPFLTALIDILKTIEDIDNRENLQIGSTLLAAYLEFVTEIDLSGVSNKEAITSLRGIDKFTDLTTLNVSGCTGLTTLDVSKAGMLKTLNASSTELKTLNISGCTALTALDISECTELTALNATGCTGLKALDVSACTNLTTLNVSGTALTALDVSRHTALTTLNVSYCQWLTIVNLTGCTAFTTLNASDTELKGLNVSGCTALTVLDVSDWTALTALDVSDCTELTALDVEGCTALTALNATGCTALTSLDVTGCTSLTSLKYYCDTKITGYSPIVYAKQLILDGSLNMAFYVAMSDTELADNTGKTASFTVGKSAAIDGTFRSDLSLTGYVDDDGKFVAGTVPSGKTETKLYAFVGEVTSVQMADAITADITVGAKTVTFDGYTVKKYLGELTADDSQTEATKNLANSVGAYGYYAQITLKETNTSYGTHTNMDEPAEGYTVTAQTDADTKTYSEHAMKIYDGDTSTVTTTPSVTYTLDLDSKTTLHVYLPSGSSLRDTGSYTGINTISTKSSTYKITSTTVTAKDTKIDDSTTYFDIAFSDIAAHELADVFTIPVTIGGTEYTIQISAMSYVNSVISKSNSNLNTAAGLDDTDSVNNYPKATHLKQAVLALDNYREKINIYRTPSNN